MKNLVGPCFVSAASGAGCVSHAAGAAGRAAAARAKLTRGRSALMQCAAISVAVLSWVGHASAADAGRLSRGAYLAAAGDCVACHSAGKTAPPFAGGLPMNSPFGTIYSSNITPDGDTGIGRYTLEDFAQAVRGGKRRDGARLYPAMPYASYAAMTDDDIAALYAYFMKEVKPVRMVPPQTRLPFPFNQRWALYFWDAAFVKHDVFKPREDRGVEWNRGAYLVQTLGHCGSCHTPRGFGYQERGYDESSPHFLTGAVVDHWYAADLSGNRASGLGRRSQADIVQLLRSGHGAGDMIFGSMRDVVEESTQYLSDDDLSAIAGYLKTLPARGEPARYRPNAVTAAAPGVRPVALRERPGAGVYNGFCAKCHGAEGTGKTGKFPALAGNPAVMLPDPSSLVRLLIEGGTAPRTRQNPKPEKMPAFDGTLRDADIADVLTYIRSAWGNDADPVTSRTVGKLHASVLKDRIKGATQPAN